MAKKFHDAIVVFYMDLILLILYNHLSVPISSETESRFNIFSFSLFLFLKRS